MGMMINLIPSLIQFYVIIVVGLLGYMMSYLSTHHPMFNLGQIEMFNRRPFCCWLCSCFWLTMFMFVNLAYLWTPMFLLWGFIMTCMTVFIIYKDGF